MNKDTIKVEMPLAEYEELVQENELMKKALDDKSIVLASYYGHKYHIVNADEKLKEVVDKINSMGIKFV